MVYDRVLHASWQWVMWTTTTTTTKKKSQANTNSNTNTYHKHVESLSNSIWMKNKAVKCYVYTIHCIAAAENTGLVSNKSHFWTMVKCMQEKKHRIDIRYLWNMSGMQIHWCVGVCEAESERKKENGWGYLPSMPCHASEKAEEREWKNGITTSSNRTKNTHLTQNVKPFSSAESNCSLFFSQHNSKDRKAPQPYPSNINIVVTLLITFRKYYAHFCHTSFLLL